MKNVRNLEGSDQFISLRVKAREDLYIFSGFQMTRWGGTLMTEVTNFFTLYDATEVPMRGFSKKTIFGGDIMSQSQKKNTNKR